MYIYVGRTYRGTNSMLRSRKPTMHGIPSNSSTRGILRTSLKFGRYYGHISEWERERANSPLNGMRRPERPRIKTKKKCVKKTLRPSTTPTTMKTNTPQSSSLSLSSPLKVDPPSRLLPGVERPPFGGRVVRPKVQTELQASSSTTLPQEAGKTK